MCTARLLKIFTKENAKKALTEGSIISYSVTNAVLYVKEPSALLHNTLMLFMDWVNPNRDDINEPVSMSVSYSLIGFAAICLTLQNYQFYSKKVREFDRVIPAEKAPESDEELGKAAVEPAAPLIQEEPPKSTCGNKLKSHSASLLKTLGASYSWYKLVSEIPVSGFRTVAAVTTALSVPGNIHSQLALLSSPSPKPVVKDDMAYHRMAR
jgi:hypothetical protein